METCNTGTFGQRGWREEVTMFKDDERKDEGGLLRCVDVSQEIYIQQERRDIKEGRNQNRAMTQSDRLTAFISSWKILGFISKFRAVKVGAVGEGLARVYNTISHTDKAGMINQWYDHLLSSSSRGNEGNICAVAPKQASNRQTDQFTPHIHTLGARQMCTWSGLHSRDGHVLCDSMHRG